jgi:hypothetical protein
MNSDYKVEAMDILLNEDCVLQRYIPLIPYKHDIIKNLKKLGCYTKSECMKLSDHSLLDIGLTDMEMVILFRNFLSLYDVKPTKLKEINSICKTPEEMQSFQELYQLPGVKSTRAMLYYKAGLRSLEIIAHSSVREVIEKTKYVIKTENLDLKVPLMKEVRTHIAVARAFTNYLDTELS